MSRRDLHDVASELRAMADRLETGDLPDTGAATDLGRRIDRAVKTVRPGPRPGQRPKQARQLAQLLAQRTGVDVHDEYKPGRNGGTYELRWANGPTADSMTTLLKELAPRVPALDVHTLSLYRSISRRAAIACLLAYLDANPLIGPDLSRRITNRYGGAQYNRLASQGDDASWDIDYPDRIDQKAERRIQAIYSLDPDGKVDGHEPTRAAWLALGDHIVRHGWRGTRDWLDHRAAQLEQATTG